MTASLQKTNGKNISVVNERDHHYHNARSLALIYLFTIGAKALVLGDTKQGREVTLQGLDDEYIAKRDILREEQLQLFRKRVCDKPGITVWKQGRNSDLRIVQIRIKLVEGRCNIVWKSKFKRKKYFDLTSLLEARPLVSEEFLVSFQSSSLVSSPPPLSIGGLHEEEGEAGAASASASFSSSNSSQKNISSSSSLASSPSFSSIKVKEQLAVPYLRLRNGSRCLDIRFSSFHESEACLQHIKTLIVNPSLNTRLP